MPNKFENWRKDFFEHKHYILVSILFLGVGLISLILSSLYVNKVDTVVASDLILDLIPTINLSFLFIWGLLLVIIVFFAYPIIYNPKKIYYAIGMAGLFLLIRSFFIILTHLQTPVGFVPLVNQGVFQFLVYSNDLFFSGHAGFPFLGFLLFQESKIKYFFLASSIILAATVLFMHVHYSIDVMGAYFITFGVFVIGNYLFIDRSLKKE